MAEGVSWVEAKRIPDVTDTGFLYRSWIIGLVYRQNERSEFELCLVVEREKASGVTIYTLAAVGRR